MTNEKESTNYYLGPDYPGIYFTPREMECLVYLLGGHTLVSAAGELGLSPRTVEFYVKNMRMKMGVANKAELIKQIRTMEFAKNLNFDHFFPNKSVAFIA